jgi:hypothetical protein
LGKWNSPAPQLSLKDSTDTAVIDGVLYAQLIYFL